MVTSKYRSSNMIILSILEAIFRAEQGHYLTKKGIVKSHLLKRCKLKASTAEKYLTKMEQAGYIISSKEPWGEREIIIYNLTEKGKERYRWFMQINAELE
ncbi:MAG: transcriptional regulator [Candidatus Lokiarchaeota archaeon]|nr:transcriptional regulator [Candidatus Harpocratesius repetitus]